MLTKAGKKNDKKELAAIEAEERHQEILRRLEEIEQSLSTLSDLIQALLDRLPEDR